MSAVGVIPWVVHEALEYLVGVGFILVGLLVFREEGVVFPLFVGVGVLLLAIAILTPGTAGIVGVLPTQVHAALDYVLGFALVISPFLFGFTDVESALLVAVLVGVGHLVLTLITRFPGTGEDASPPAPAEET